MKIDSENDSVSGVCIDDMPYAVVFGQYLKNIEPIPLTPEWLERFGFETRTTETHSVQYFIGENPITKDWLFDILWLQGEDCPFYRNGFFKIQHVHQLQNLYFALTGEELTYKP